MFHTCRKLVSPSFSGCLPQRVTPLNSNVHHSQELAVTPAVLYVLIEAINCAAFVVFATTTFLEAKRALTSD